MVIQVIEVICFTPMTFFNDQNDFKQIAGVAEW